MDKYLYEIIEDYKNADTEEKKTEIFKDFCSSIWGSKNKRRVYNKTIKFKVRNDLLKTDVGQVFNTWSEVNYISHKTFSKDTDWCSLIRQKINNIYTRYFDKDVILKKDYMDLLKTSKRLYYRWINGEQMDVDEITNIIEDSIYKAAELKCVYQKQKMNLSWSDYKKVVEDFLKLKFDKCKLIEDYEREHLTSNVIYDFYNEDNSYIKYICNSLELYMLDYQKQYYGLKRGKNKQYKRCKECGSLIEIRSKNDHSTKYCNVCKKKRDLDKYKKYNKKRRKMA